MRTLIFSLLLSIAFILPPISYAEKTPIYDQGEITTTYSSAEEHPAASDDFLTLYRRPDFSIGATSSGSREILLSPENHRFVEGISGLLLGIRIEFN